MDGQTLCRDVRKLLLEGDSSSFVDDRVTMDMLWEAAQQLNAEMQWNTKEYSFTTIVNQTNYTLPADFQELYVMDNLNYYVLRINDGTSDTFFRWREFDKIYQDRVFFTGGQPIPNNFSIVDTTPTAQVTGAASMAGANTYGLSTLFVTPAVFQNVSVGDIVHNITDGSDGLVTQVLSTFAVQTALWNGANDDWTGGDHFVITPQPRLAVVLDPMPSVSGYTVYVPYVSRPDPVYSLYQSYNFPVSWRYALTKYAAWMYKYRDKEPNYGDAWFKHWDDLLRKSKRIANRVRQRTSFKVNYNKRNLTDRSWR